MTTTRINKDGKLQQYNYAVKEHILKQGVRQDGYSDVSLSDHGVTILHCVHRLLAEAWIPNPNNYNYVNHIDLDKTNNSLSNLEWVSNSGNVNHAVERYANPQSIAVYCKETNKVYSSMGQCDKALNLNQGSTWSVIHKNSPCPYTLSLATEEQISDARNKIEGNCGWTFDFIKKGRLHPVRQIKCINNQEVYSTLVAASLSTGCCQDSIRESIRNKVPCKGLVFYYLDEAPDNEQNYFLGANERHHRNISESKKRIGRERSKST